MEEYTVNFLADIDVKIIADSPEEARKKAEKCSENITIKSLIMRILLKLNLLQK